MQTLLLPNFNLPDLIKKQPKKLFALLATEPIVQVKIKNVGTFLISSDATLIEEPTFTFNEYKVKRI